jgi:pyrroloquinoline quinone biosynthesis protein B
MPSPAVSSPSRNGAARIVPARVVTIWAAAVWLAVVLVAVARAGDDAIGDGPFVVVLGVAQDGGRPQAGCAKPCCAAAWTDAAARRRVACLGVVDPTSGDRWLVDATPDFALQLRSLDALQAPRTVPDLSGILVTHAHVGHYAGLAQLGREVLGARRVPVFAMPRLRAFLRTNGPWSQLVTLENIAVVELKDGVRVALGPHLGAVPFLVPHRDEFSETVGFRIEGRRRSVAWVPDIDKWERWSTRVEDLIASVDVAYLDGTFYANGEIPNRDMAEIPHPFIVETLERLARLPATERAKVRFVHLNHTNPALDAGSAASTAIEAAGFRVAREMERVGL